MKTISPNELNRLHDEGKKINLLDVRTEVEFEECHSTYSRNIPLDRLNPEEVVSQLNGNKDEPIYIICKSGSRGRSACDKFEKAGYTDVINVDGGTDAWDQQNLPVVRGKKVRIPLDAQVRLIIGFFVLLGSIMTYAGYPSFVYLTMFFGAGLIISGLTNFCGLALILGRMPWNRMNGSSGATCSR